MIVIVVIEDLVFCLELITMATKNVTCSKLSIVDIKSSFADGVEVGDDIPVKPQYCYRTKQPL